MMRVVLASCLALMSPRYAIKFAQRHPFVYSQQSMSNAPVHGGIHARLWC